MRIINCKRWRPVILRVVKLTTTQEVEELGQFLSSPICIYSPSQLWVAEVPHDNVWVPGEPEALGVPHENRDQQVEEWSLWATVK